MDLQIQWMEWANKEREQNKKGWRREKRSLAGSSEGCAHGDSKLPSLWLTDLVVREGGALAQNCSMSMSSVITGWKGEVWSFCCWEKKSTNGYAGRYRTITLQINRECAVTVYVWIFFALYFTPTLWHCALLLECCCFHFLYWLVSYGLVCASVNKWRQIFNMVLT